MFGSFAIRRRWQAALPWLAAASLAVSLGAQVRPEKKTEGISAGANATSVSCNKMAGRLLDISGYGDSLRGATAISRSQFRNGLAAMRRYGAAPRSSDSARFWLRRLTQPSERACVSPLKRCGR